MIKLITIAGEVSMDGENISIIQLFKNIENIFTKPARVINNIVFYFVIIFVLSDHFAPKIFHHLTEGIDRTDTLLSFVIFIMSGTLKLLFHIKEEFDKQLRDLHHVISNGSITQHKQEVDAIAIFPRLIENIDVSRIDIIQISGQNIVDIVARICGEKNRCKFRILLLDPELANSRFVNQQYHMHIARLTATINQIEIKSLAVRVEIRFYRSEPSVCAIIADDRAAVLSWYRANFEEDGQVVHGHNSAAVIDNGSESGTLRKFAQSHFAKVWNDRQTYSLEEFNKRIKFAWKYDLGGPINPAPDPL